MLPVIDPIPNSSGTNNPTITVPNSNQTLTVLKFLTLGCQKLILLSLHCYTNAIAILRYLGNKIVLSPQEGCYIYVLSSVYRTTPMIGHQRLRVS